VRRNNNPRSTLKFQDYLIKREPTGVDPLRPRRTYERSIDARFIKVVALLNGSQHCFVIRWSTLRAHLINTTSRTNFGMRIQIEANDGIRKHNGPLIATFRYESWMRATNSTLRFNHRRPQCRLAGNNAHCNIDISVANAFGEITTAKQKSRRTERPIECETFFGNTRGEGYAVIGGHAFIKRNDCSSSVHRAGIEHLKSETLCKFPGN